MWENMSGLGISSYIVKIVAHLSGDSAVGLLPVMTGIPLLTVQCFFSLQNYNKCVDVFIEQQQKVRW